VVAHLGDARVTEHLLPRSSGAFSHWHSGIGPMHRSRRLQRLSQRTLHHVRFADLRDLVQGFDYRLLRISSSHHIFSHPDISALVNLQEVRGEAKPYLIRQFLRLVERYNVHLEDEPRRTTTSISSPTTKMAVTSLTPLIWMRASPSVRLQSRP
jgi:hypothetical protein